MLTLSPLHFPAIFRPIGRREGLWTSLSEGPNCAGVHSWPHVAQYPSIKRQDLMGGGCIYAAYSMSVDLGPNTLVSPVLPRYHPLAPQGVVAS